MEVNAAPLGTGSREQQTEKATGRQTTGSPSDEGCAVKNMAYPVSKNQVVTHMKMIHQVSDRSTYELAGLIRIGFHYLHKPRQDESLKQGSAHWQLSAIHRARATGQIQETEEADSSKYTHVDVD